MFTYLVITLMFIKQTCNNISFHISGTCTLKTSFGAFSMYFCASEQLASISKLLKTNKNV